MSPSERDTLLSERSTGLGGSDIASLLQPYLRNEVKYGCRRRLWYLKSQRAPDYPQDDTGPMQLGRILEPYIAQWHSEATGDQLSTPKTIRHPEFPELLVHIDRIVEDSEHDTPGAAEIKALGPDMFWQTKREGIIVDYLLQLQHGMLCSGPPTPGIPHSGLSWGKFIVGNRAYGGKPLSWSHVKDPDIHEAILAEGPAFWKTLGNDEQAPARLEPDDKRCGTCQWRKTCQGQALMHSTDKDHLPQAEDIRPLLIEYDQVSAKFCEKLSDGSRGTADDLRLEEIKQQIKAVLDRRYAVAVAWPGGKDRKIYFRQQDGRTIWQTEELLRAYERLRQTGREAVAELGVQADFDKDFPPGESFRREGVPFRVLRIY